MKLFIGLLFATLAFNGVLSLPARDPSEDAEVIGGPRRVSTTRDDADDDDDFTNFKGVVDTGSGYPFLQPNPSVIRVGFFDSFDDLFRRFSARLFPTSLFGGRTDGDDSDEAASGEVGFPAFDSKKANTTSTVKVVDGHKVEVNETVYGDANSVFKVRVVNIRPLEDGETVEESVNTNKNSGDDVEGVKPVTSAPNARNPNAETADDDDSDERREPLAKKPTENEIQGNIDDPEVNISQQEYVTKYREYLERLRDDLVQFHEDEEYSLKPLQILSIVSNNTIHNNFDDQADSYEFHSKRQTREIMDADEEQEQDDEEDNDNGNTGNSYKGMDDIGKHIKNILFLRKKHQKPRSTKKQRDERKTNIRLMFTLKPEALNLTSDYIEDANIRLVLIHNPTLAKKNHMNKKKNKRKHKNNSCGSAKVDKAGAGSTSASSPRHQVNVLNLKLFFINKTGKRIWLDGRKVEILVDPSKPDETHTQWLQFDVIKAVKMTIDDGRYQHISLELQCDNCKRIGARILNDGHNTMADAALDDPSTEGYQLMPVLNIVGRFGQNKHTMRPHKHHSSIDQTNSKEETTTQRLYHHHQVYNDNDDKNPQRHNNRRTNCYKANQRCCRHSMEVTFKEIKGFEFIIQPKVFDAGYCHGRCPPRYNPAHHHAMLQSLIWKQNPQKAPRPCCAPSKLAELEVLHVDEKDSEKLKISTWSDMKVVECACS